jgi:hypothetical protein
MDDDFLKQYRKQPDSAFVESVYHKINTEKRGGSMMKKLSLAFAIFLATIAITLGVSPQARGAALELIREVGGLRFHVTSDYPGAGEDVEIVDSTYVSLDEARQIFPGAISLPDSIPGGYSLDPEVELIDFQDGNLPMAIIHWQKTTPEGRWGNLVLRISYTKETTNYSEVVGEGAIQEITINGRPAALVSGGWSYDTRSYDFGINSQRIQWMYDENTSYSLESQNEAISKEALIEIAESIP